MKNRPSRRNFLKQSLIASSPALLPSGLLFAQPDAVKPLKVVCIGGHPDDPESACAGTLIRYAEAGHTVTVLYLTRGERGVSGKTNDEAATIRTAEAEKACQLMGAKPVFAGQIDGSAEINKKRVEDLVQLLSGEKPDVLFTHWPIDTHLDHQVASLLAIRAYLALTQRPQFYFFEVNVGSQSMGFAPNTYVDITTVLDKKKAALFAHRSQDGEAVWREHHEIMANFRGREAGVKAAEAFFHLKDGALPGL